MFFGVGCKKSGVYGINCDVPCPTMCTGNTCHIQSGACFECERGTYGRNCENKCPTNCENNACHIGNGTCFECSAGWSGMTCDTSTLKYNIANKFLSAFFYI